MGWPVAVIFSCEVMSNYSSIICFSSLSFAKVLFSRESLQNLQKERQPPRFGVTIVWPEMRAVSNLSEWQEMAKWYAFHSIDIHSIGQSRKNCQWFLAKITWNTPVVEQFKFITHRSKGEHTLWGAMRHLSRTVLKRTYIIRFGFVGWSGGLRSKSNAVRKQG